MSRYGSGTAEESQPLLWWRGHPVYATHALAAGLVATMLLTTVLLFLRATEVLGWFGFASAEVWQGQVWRVLTYGLVNAPSLGFALDLLMLVWFGREVERFLGRVPFLQLYAGIYLVKPLLFTALGPLLRTSFAGEVGAFAVFIAFATLFPNVPLLFNILAKWAALVLVGISALVALAARDGVGLIGLGATCGFAYGFVRLQQGELRFSLPRIRGRTSAPALRPVPDARPRGAPKVAAVEPPSAPPSAMAEVDALLDKIAQHGIHSLTAAERARLESARSNLLKRGGGR